jgi:hypothetical protein
MATEVVMLAFRFERISQQITRIDHMASVSLHRIDLRTITSLSFMFISSVLSTMKVASLFFTLPTQNGIIDSDDIESSSVHRNTATTRYLCSDEQNQESVRLKLPQLGTELSHPILEG